ncbi:CAP domain-containing protein [Haloarcula limicola]|uniref:CAP domain-containing protein n=1 Tax=Haloarcula limicola TaxID=1429915 RepID=UPI001F5122ED|nr:CAP domain-containing protein [Halomicroarcula limicola]
MSTEIAKQAGVYQPLSAFVANLSTNESANVSTASSSSTKATYTTADPEDQTTNSGSNEIDISAVEMAIHEEVNQRRTANGLGQLEYRSDLVEVARYHSKDMASKGYFSHDSPNGESLGDRYQRFGINCAGGENIAYTYWEENIQSEGRLLYYDSEQDVAIGLVNQWMNSTGHRENILRERFQSEGIGISVAEVDGATRIYATQNFC